jgi:hypothetical protein
LNVAEKGATFHFSETSLPTSSENSIEPLTLEFNRLNGRTIGDLSELHQPILKYPVVHSFGTSWQTLLVTNILASEKKSSASPQIIFNSNSGHNRPFGTIQIVRTSIFFCLARLHQHVD